MSKNKQLAKRTWRLLESHGIFPREWMSWRRANLVKDLIILCEWYKDQESKGKVTTMGH